MITKAEIHDSLDAMLANPKSKNFLNHLVRAYFPISQVEKVWDKQPTEITCVLSKAKLTTVQEILEASQTEEFKQNFLLHLKSIFDEKATAINPIQKLVSDKLLAIQGANTTTFMSYPAYLEFYEWVVTKSLEGDKHINWLLGSIRRSSFIEQTQYIQDDAVQKKVKAIKKQTSMVSTYTIGETDAFKALREKFNK
jgi:hypothetical protein